MPASPASASPSIAAAEFPDAVSEAEEEGVRYRASDLKRYVQSILQAVGTPEELEALDVIVAAELLDSGSALRNLGTHDSFST